MNIVVLVKQVPDTYSERKLAAADHTLDRESADAVLDEINERAVEEALLIKEAQGGEVTVVRPSGELFVRQIADAGGRADLHVAEGMPHGYLNRSPWLDEVRRTLDLFTATTALSPQ